VAPALLVLEHNIKKDLVAFVNEVISRLAAAVQLGPRAQCKKWRKCAPALLFLEHNNTKRSAFVTEVGSRRPVLASPGPGGRSSPALLVLEQSNIKKDRPL